MNPLVPYAHIYIYNIRVRGYPLNGIFGPCACLLAGGSGACRLLARRRRRRRRRRRHSVLVPLGDPKVNEHLLNPKDTCSKNPGACFF